MFKGWTTLIDASKLGGWVRAGVASALTAVLAKSPAVAQWVDPSMQDAFAMFASAVVVGIWSHLAKKIDG